jgi:HEAT repeat protein
MADEPLAAARAFDHLNPRSLSAKREYVRGLERRRDPEAISLLVECLCDESGYLRDLAQQAFERLGDEAAPMLVPLLEQGLWFTRTSAAGVLGALGHRPAVPALLALAEDRNRTVAEAAGVALVAVGLRGGAFRIAHVLHRLAPEARRRRIEEMARRDAALARRVTRLMADDALMTLDDDGALADDSPAVRAADEGAAGQVLTGPTPPPESPGAGGGDGGRRTA